MRAKAKVKVALKIVNGSGPYAYLQRNVNRPGKSSISEHIAYLGKQPPNTRVRLPDHLQRLTGRRVVKIPPLTSRQAAQLRGATRRQVEQRRRGGKPRLPECRHCGGQLLRFPSFDEDEALRCVQCGRRPPRPPARGYCPRCGGSFGVTKAGVLRAHVGAGVRSTLCAGSGQPPAPEPELRVRRVAP